LKKHVRSAIASTWTLPLPLYVQWGSVQLPLAERKQFLRDDYNDINTLLHCCRALQSTLGYDTVHVDDGCKQKLCV